MLTKITVGDRLNGNKQQFSLNSIITHGDDGYYVSVSGLANMIKIGGRVFNADGSGYDNIGDNTISTIMLTCDDTHSNSMYEYAGEIEIVVHLK